MLRKWFSALTPLGRFTVHAISAFAILGAFVYTATALISSRHEARMLRDNPCIQHEQRMREAVHVILHGGK